MILLGAGGHAAEILQVLLYNDYAGEIVFFDNTGNDTSKLFDKYPVVKSDAELAARFKNDPDFVPAVGNPFARKKLFDLAVELGGKPCNIVAKTAITSLVNHKTGAGLNVMHGVFISENVTIEDGVLLNAFCHVHHGASVGEFSEISPKAMILGGSSVGKFAQIGAGAVVLPGVRVGDKAVVGAGAVVTADIPGDCVAAGVPAKVIKGAG